MQPRLDQNRPARRRRGLALAAIVGCVGLLAGCSGGASPEDQREEMIAATTAVLETVAQLADLGEPEVLDDATEPIDCPAGLRYQYVAYATTERYVDEPEVDARLDDVTVVVFAGTVKVPGGPEYYSGSDRVELDPDGDGPRQLTFFVDEGAGAGISLEVDYQSMDDGRVLVGFEGSTRCG